MNFNESIYDTRRQACLLAEADLRTRRTTAARHMRDYRSLPVYGYQLDVAAFEDWYKATTNTNDAVADYKKMATYIQEKYSDKLTLVHDPSTLDLYLSLGDPTKPHEVNILTCSLTESDVEEMAAALKKLVEALKLGGDPANYVLDEAHIYPVDLSRSAVPRTHTPLQTYEEFCASELGMALANSRAPFHNSVEQFLRDEGHTPIQTVPLSQMPPMPQDNRPWGGIDPELWNALLRMRTAEGGYVQSGSQAFGPTSQPAQTFTAQHDVDENAHMDD